MNTVSAANNITNVIREEGRKKQLIPNEDIEEGITAELPPDPYLEWTQWRIAIHSRR